MDAYLMLEDSIKTFQGWVIFLVIMGILITIYFIVIVGVICSYLKKHVQQTKNSLRDIKKQLNTLDDVFTQMYELKDRLDSIKSAVEKPKEISVENDKKENSSTLDKQ